MKLISNDSFKNDILLNGGWIDLPKIMKRLNFVEDIGFFTRNFTRIYVLDNQLYIGHIINKKKTKIEFENINEWVSYFDRI